MKKLVPKDKKTDYYQSGFKWILYTNVYSEFKYLLLRENNNKINQFY
jgi:hypothetical protein